MSTMTTLSKYSEQGTAAQNCQEETQNTDFTQVACCAIRGEDESGLQGRKLLQGHNGESAYQTLKKKFAAFF